MTDSLVEAYFEKHPEDAARVLATAPNDVLFAIFYNFPDQMPDLIAYLSPSFIANVISNAPKHPVTMMANKMSENQIAMVVRLMSKRNAEKLLSSLEPENAKRVYELLNYNEKQIGYYAERANLILSQSVLVADVLFIVEKLKDLNQPIYVVDEEYRLQGTIGLFEVIKQRHQVNQTIENVLTRLSLVFKATTPLDQVIDHPAWNEYDKIPVIGDHDVFLGIISKAFLTKDFDQMIAASEQKLDDDSYFGILDKLWVNLVKVWEV